MNLASYQKEEIALNQLETALRLFFEGGELFSVITLAGAAEEILGQLLQGKGGQGRGTFRSVLDLLRPRAATAGSGSPSRETELQVHMDVQHEARFLLSRAIEDYHALTGRLTPAMLRFNEKHPFPG